MRVAGAALQAAMDAGVPRQCIALDPGLGFGKNVQQNFARSNGCQSPVCAGLPSAGGRQPPLLAL
ncbi:MAG: hypothetical protein U0636_04545 [Phycisphaerales bacterium]